jgi:hypothetical protein
MGQKQIMNHAEALLEMKKGVDQLADAVKCTMGPAGRHVVIEKSYGGPSVTKDGVSVAKEVELPEPFESWARRWCTRSPRRPPTRPATARPPPPCSPRRSSPRASST